MLSSLDITALSSLLPALRTRICVVPLARSHNQRKKMQRLNATNPKHLCMAGEDEHDFQQPKWAALIYGPPAYSRACIATLTNPPRYQEGGGINSPLQFNNKGQYTIQQRTQMHIVCLQTGTSLHALAVSPFGSASSPRHPPNHHGGIAGQDCSMCHTPTHMPANTNPDRDGHGEGAAPSRQEACNKTMKKTAPWTSHTGNTTKDSNNAHHKNAGRPGRHKNTRDPTICPRKQE